MILNLLVLVRLLHVVGECLLHSDPLYVHSIVYKLSLQRYRPLRLFVEKWHLPPCRDATKQPSWDDRGSVFSPLFR